MAAVHHPSSSRPLTHSRLRSSSDPFNDAHEQHSRRPPPPPPKSAAATPTKMPSNPSGDVRDAVRDTVTYRSSAERHRPSRSQTTSMSPAQPNTTSRTPGRRSHSEDRGPIVEKTRASGKTGSKKGSKHADVIDRLDFTGVGPMFHHDGPFDACAPSRNKHKNQAPLYSWTPAELAQQSAGNGGAYPSAYAYQAFSNDYPEPPKKKVDAIAEAWGIHEPEPFEEFFAGGGTGKQEGDTPGSSIYNGKTSSRRSKDESRDTRTRGNAVRRPGVPPPQPIFVPDATEAIEPQSGSPGSPGFPKRSKSLMQRIRKMRDAPNVPVGAEYEAPQSPSTPTGAYASDGPSRPTHRSQNSFLGRFGVKSNQSAPLPSHYEEPEPYIFIDNQNTSNQDKALPATPQGGRYASENTALESNYAGIQPSQQSGAPLGRKTSLMKKVGRAVRGRERP